MWSTGDGCRSTINSAWHAHHRHQVLSTTDRRLSAVYHTRRQWACMDKYSRVASVKLTANLHRIFVNVAWGRGLVYMTHLKFLVPLNIGADFSYWVLGHNWSDAVLRGRDPLEELTDYNDFNAPSKKFFWLLSGKWRLQSGRQIDRHMTTANIVLA